MTSTPDHWQKVQILFDSFRKEGVAQISNELNWVINGLFVGTTKELRPSVAIAHNVTYTILVSLISEIQDDKSREKTFETEFLPRVRQYLTAKKADASISGGLGHALSVVSRPHDLEIIWTDVCRYLIELMSQPFGVFDSEIDFVSVSQRWTELITSILRNYSTTPSHQKQDYPTESIFLKISARPFEEAVSKVLNSDGAWVDGILFLTSLVENTLFWNALLESTEMDNAMRAVNVLVSTEHAVKLLHSASSRLFIRMVLVYCNSNDTGAPDVWQILINEGIPTDRPIDVQNPEALIYQLVSIFKPPLQVTSTDRHQSILNAPRGVNVNLAQELTTALKSQEDFESPLAKQLEGLLISLCCLHGNAISGVSNILGILISDETSLVLLRSWDLDSPTFIHVVTEVCARDPSFAGVLLQPNSKGYDNSWDVSGLLWNLYK
jgi:hypothetical protein